MHHLKLWSRRAHPRCEKIVVEEEYLVMTSSCYFFVVGCFEQRHHIKPTRTGDPFCNHVFLCFSTSLPLTVLPSLSSIYQRAPECGRFNGTAEWRSFGGSPLRLVGFAVRRCRIIISQRQRFLWHQHLLEDLTRTARKKSTKMHSFIAQSTMARFVLASWTDTA